MTKPSEKFLEDGYQIGGTAWTPIRQSKRSGAPTVRGYRLVFLAKAPHYLALCWDLGFRSYPMNPDLDNVVDGFLRVRSSCYAAETERYRSSLQSREHELDRMGLCRGCQRQYREGKNRIFHRPFQGSLALNPSNLFSIPVGVREHYAEQLVYSASVGDEVAILRATEECRRLTRETERAMASFIEDFLRAEDGVKWLNSQLYWQADGTPASQLKSDRTWQILNSGY